MRTIKTFVALPFFVIGWLLFIFALWLSPDFLDVFTTYLSDRGFRWEDVCD